MTPPCAPYRDEAESLRAENERLRAALKAGRTRRRIRFGVTAGLLALELAAIFVLQPWLNAKSDFSF